MRLLLLGFLSAASMGCEVAAAVDLHYTDASGDAAAPADGNVVVSDGQAVGDAGQCGCPLEQGIGCCLPHASSPFCSADIAGCAGNGGLFLACQLTTNDSPCCWSGNVPNGSGAHVTYTGACDNSRVAFCTTTADCATVGGGECRTTMCDGIRVGACGATPVCP